MTIKHIVGMILIGIGLSGSIVLRFENGWLTVLMFCFLGLGLEILIDAKIEEKER